MTDDSNGRPRRPGSMGDSDRALVGRKHRTAPARGVPIHPRPADFDRWAAGSDTDAEPRSDDDLPADAELTGPSELVMADPVAREIWDHVDRVARRGVRRHRDTGNRIAEVHADAGNQHLGARLEALEKKLKWWQGLVLSALTAAGGSLFVVAKGLFERGAKEGAAEVRLQYVERAAEQNRAELGVLRDHIDTRRQPDRPTWLWPPTATTTTAPKGPTQ
jgi:hypothetical protein